MQPFALRWVNFRNFTNAQQATNYHPFV